MLWLRYPQDFPHGVDFTIGKSDPAKDVNFMQPLLAPSNATSPTCQSCPPHPPAALESTWKISFATAPLRGYKRLALTVGILSPNGHATGIDLLLNGKVVGHVNATAFQDSETGRIVGTHVSAPTVGLICHGSDGHRCCEQVDIRAWVLSGSQPPIEAVEEAGGEGGRRRQHLSRSDDILARSHDIHG